ncbi:ATP12 family chaperone protein [Caulobacter mirabilis]|uniref:ATPase n=1 Tax=Caulobacter mirabilis TaxID=69666 RepID=A0A2D2AX54_9CAUL|nr:ATP12 family protein [Caulobacter mirabilis]ATQ42598.1 ATPase [Caulobacter mirabilis]
MSDSGAGVQRPKRFYKTVTVGPLDGGFAPLLDGRAPKTPAGQRLVLPSEALAALVAEDWDAQTDEIDVARMPAMRMAATALDRVSQAREDVAEEVVRYAGSDLICYFAEHPAGLIAEQEIRWGTLLAWAEVELGLKLERAEGVLHRPQASGALDRARTLALSLDDFGLTALAHATALFGSAVIALALQRGEITGQEAHDLARLDEAWQEERWGVDYEAADRTAARLAEALLLERWFKALR